MFGFSNNKDNIHNGNLESSDKSGINGHSSLQDSLNFTGMKILEGQTNTNVGKLSYWKGDTSEPLKNLTVGQLVKNAASLFADRTAISVHQGGELTYAQVDEQTELLAAAYVALGLEKGDHVAIWGFNSIEWYLSFLAAMKAGLVAVNLNPVIEAPELESCLLLSDAKALILNEKSSDRSLYAILSQVIPEIQHSKNETRIETKALPLLKTVIIVSENDYSGTYKWDSLFEIPKEEHKLKIKNLQSTINTFDVCDIQFTSGTTSQPKGVLLTHHNIVNNGFLVGKYLLLKEKCCKPCVLIPFFHAYGMAAGLLSSICYGATLTLPFAKYNSTKTVQCIIDQKCTLIYGTPTMFIDLLSVVGTRLKEDPEIISKMSSLERFYTGGALCLPEVVRKLKKNFYWVKISSAYGMTELSPTTVISLPHEPEDKILKTLGRVLDHMEAKVVDEKRNTVPLGTPGEMCFRGHMVMKGYYKNAHKTSEVLDEEGWFYTGDKFIMLENGYTQIVGRIKDTIIRGGENIDPGDIEEVILKLEGIVDVQVYGVFDERLGEVVAVSIIKTEKSDVCENDIRKFCQGKIATYKIPKYIDFCTDYPRTASGKIKKFNLRSALEEKLGLNTVIKSCS